MRFLIYFASSFIACVVCFYSLIVILFPTPVAAEYWVRELLVFKRDVAKKLATCPKSSLLLDRARSLTLIRT